MDQRAADRPLNLAKRTKTVLDFIDSIHDCDEAIWVSRLVKERHTLLERAAIDDKLRLDDWAIGDVITWSGDAHRGPIVAFTRGRYVLARDLKTGRQWHVNPLLATHTEKKS